MYLDFYSLNEKPFSNVPDTAFLYRCSQHAGAISHILYGINSKAGFMLLTGGVGTGKTTICRALLHELDNRFETALIFNPPPTPEELIVAILQDLGIAFRKGTKKDLISTLNHHLLKFRSENRHAVVIIDEAQNLQPEVLEEIRLLSNLETEKEKLIQIILVGQEELLEKIDRYDLRQLRQRISIHFHLTPLKRNEIAKYIQYRLLKAGSSGELSFTENAIRAIYRFSGGVPRLINLICDKALLAGYIKQKKTITASMIKIAVKDTIFHNRGVKAPFIRILNRRIKPACSISVLIICIMLAAFSEKQLPALAVNNSHDLSFPVACRNLNLKKIPAKPSVSSLKPAGQTGMPDSNSSVNTLSFDPDGIMRTNHGFACAVEALATILRAWDIPEERVLKSISSWKNGRTFSFRKHVKEFGLKATATHVSLEQITSLNYPCIVKIHEGRKYRYVVLSGTGDNTVTLLDPEKGKTVIPAGMFQKTWNGKVFYIWKDFDNFPSGLKHGRKNRALISLKKKFKKLGFNIKHTGSGYFDRELEKTVMSFQGKWGLEPDGVFGLQTKLAMYRLLYPSEIPALNSCTHHDS